MKMRELELETLIISYIKTNGPLKPKQAYTRPGAIPIQAPHPAQEKRGKAH